MSSTVQPTVTRVRADQWREVREARLDALRDPLAPLAFLETYEQRRLMPDDFWKARASGAAEGPRVSQWVARVGGTWAGAVEVLTFRVGETDYYGNTVTEDRANLVGVYIQPDSRRAGLLEQLIDAAAAWTADMGFTELQLDVHPDNLQAIKAYLRCGFVDSGERVPYGDTADVVMRLDLDARANRAS